MTRVALPRPEEIADPAIEGIFAWVTEKEGSVPNHFYVELNFPEFLLPNSVPPKCYRKWAS